MANIKKAIVTALVTLAVMIYTIHNYVNGKTDFVTFIVCMMIMGIPMINMINLLIQERKNR